eukprot:TRINITY_DN509_c0_g1_i6.p1 TRINITY_DN509_c0_g1~~TRINITY_DN509_c0_g1_i6.p1  ORF type:complete len:141 (-),score=22.74 TRINITY_DN509_c0_g1_i6:71-493(-)
MKEIGQLVGVNLTFPSLGPSEEENGIASAFSGATTIIQQVASTWSSVVGAFKSSKNQTLEKTLAGQGFDHFAQSAQTQMIGGLMESFLPTFLQQLATRLEAVSYTHLTLPTKRIVQISVVAVSLKKKKKNKAKRIQLKKR